MTATLVNRFQPSHLVACWDDDWRPQWRIDLVPTYKGHRVVEETERCVPDVEEVPEPESATRECASIEQLMDASEGVRQTDGERPATETRS